VDAVADLFDGSVMQPSDEARALLTDIFMALVRQAERDLRKRVAERLAPADWAPMGLIQLLMLDEIEIARPIIARSPLLGDAELIRLLVEATLEHQVEVARRPMLSGGVVNVILDGDKPEVLTALAGNETADISPLAMARLVTASRRIAAVRAPLTRHPRLTPALAQSLYSWVGDALKANLTGRYPIDPADFADVVDEAVRDQARLDPEVAALIDPDVERDELEHKLIEKLQAAGQLRPGYLLRALREGRLSLFAHALATLGRCEVSEVRAAMDAPTPEPLALACTAVGLDRGAFPTILSLVRALNGGRPGASSAGAMLAAGLRPNVTTH